METNRWQTVKEVALLGGMYIGLGVGALLMFGLCVAIVAGCYCIPVAVLWFCWNTLAPLFGGPEMTFVQAIAAMLVIVFVLPLVGIRLFSITVNEKKK